MKNTTLPDKVSELHKLWNIDDDGEGEGGHEIAEGALLERDHGASGDDARMLLVHEKGMTNSQIPKMSCTSSIYIKQSPFQRTGVLSKTSEWIELKLDPNFFRS